MNPFVQSRTRSDIDDTTKDTFSTIDLIRMNHDDGHTLSPYITVTSVLVWNAGCC